MLKLINIFEIFIMIAVSALKSYLSYKNHNKYRLLGSINLITLSVLFKFPYSDMLSNCLKPNRIFKVTRITHVCV